MTFALRSQFEAHVFPTVSGGERQVGVASGDIQDFDSLTYEFNDSPFHSLVRKIETLCDTDPVSAYYLLLSAENDGIYNHENEIELLDAKKDEIIHIIEDDVWAHRNEKEGLGALFGEKVLDSTITDVFNTFPEASAPAANQARAPKPPQPAI